MLNLLGFLLLLPSGLEFLANPIPTLFINLAAWALIALFTNYGILRLLKLVTHRWSGEVEDIILGILDRPILILIGLYGIVTSLDRLPLLPVVLKWVWVLNDTLVVLVVTQVLGRLIRDVLVYYGERWATRTETHVDDVLIPVLNLFGPLLLVIIAGLIILPMWGVDVTSVLLGAGVLGLVLGLAMQETLGNIFSGLSLLVEAPFRKGDLVALSDGRTCEVMHLGMRSTMLFSLAEQATIYLPNKLLSSSMLVNLTKPTSEQRFCIDITIDQSANLAQVQNSFFLIADGHPAVLSSNMATKLTHARKQIDYIRQQAGRMHKKDPAAQNLLAEADKNERTLAKLELEGELNIQILVLKDALRNLVRGLTASESHGLNSKERQDLSCDFVSPADSALEGTMARTKSWCEAQDAWLTDSDYWSQQKLWENRNEQLHLHWERLKKAIYAVDNDLEARLDDSCKMLLDWIEKEYKVPPGEWKNPTVEITALEGTNTHLQLCYYVDNIRLEHDSRPRRVRSELSRMVREKLVDCDL